MKVLKSKDIVDIVRRISLRNENLNPFAGSGSNRRLVIKNGLKLIHKPTGLVYAVVDVLLNEPKDPVIVCKRADQKIEITKDSFKDYERQ